MSEPKTTTEAASSQHDTGSATCVECNWTNVSLLNLGEPENPRWVCHGCCKRAYEHAGKYRALIMAVARQFRGESRHETALRYIREAEDRAMSGGECDKTPNAPAQPRREEGQQ